MVIDEHKHVVGPPVTASPNKKAHKDDSRIMGVEIMFRFPALYICFLIVLALSSMSCAASKPASIPPSPSPEIDFPLALNNTWVYQVTWHEQVPTTEIMTTTRTLTETVVEVKNTSSYFAAKIREDQSAEMPVVIPKSTQSEPLRPAESYEYWLVVNGNRLYRQERNLDLTQLDTALLEFVFPLQLGAKWYLSDEKAKLNPTYADDWMLRKVTQVDTVVVPAGRFNNCFFLEDEWADATFEIWFCPNVGVVDRKSDSKGRPEGFRKMLIRYQLEK